MRELERELAAGTLTQDQFAAAKGELEARLAEDLRSAPPDQRSIADRPRKPRAIPLRILATTTAVLVAGGAWWLYTLIGAPTAIDATMYLAPYSSPLQKSSGPRAPLPSMEALTQRLALKMRTQTPDDGEGWALLARSYVELKQYREAAEAFAEAAKRITNDATLLADYADALGMANGKTLRGEPAALAQRALKADPKQPKALALAASAAFEVKKYREAAAYWERLRAVLPQGSDEARGVEVNIAEARGLLEGKVPSASPMPARDADVTGSKASITGSIRVSPELAAKVKSGDTLYVYARALTGPSMPLAIVRTRAASFPYGFRLDDGQAMLPELRLSRVSEVALTARLSHGGAATPQAGDLQGTVTPVKVGANDVELVIDEIVR